MKTYFNRINAGVKSCYDVAQDIKDLGIDPDKTCIPLAKNMAERVEGLISVIMPQIKNSGVVERIGDLEKQHGVQDWRISMQIALEVAQEKFCKFKDKREAMETGMRVGLAYITNGVVSSPLEGFVKLEIRKRKDGKEYFALFFSGPIRSAGTTATCVFAAVCDYIRVNMGYEPYDPSEIEVKRMVTELYDFHERVTNLQYLPSEQEISFMVSHLPLQIDGDPSEKFEVSNYKDLPRIETNRLRNGVCLVIGEGLTQKGKKFWTKFSKWCKDFNMEHWIFMEEFVKLQSEIKSKLAKAKTTSEAKVSPDGTYLKDLVGGRPIFAYPLANGGFRLRYGRCRTSGFSSDAIHPATMVVLDEFLAIGSQLRTERPGKSTTLSACDYMEGPIVKLKDGTVIYLESAEQAKSVLKNIQEIIYLGDILINYGDFLNRGHTLLPAGFCEEWWILYLKKYLNESNYKVNEELLENPIKYKIPVEDAVKISLDTKIPFHPRYTYHWKNIRFDQFKMFLDWIVKSVVNHEKGKVVKIILPYEEEPKRIMELLGIPHKAIGKEYVILEKNEAFALAFQLGFNESMTNFARFQEVIEGLPLEIVNRLCPVIVKDKSGYFIGARMGRPEKAKMRKMTGDPHGLFSIGKEGGRLRSIQSALEIGKVKADYPVYFCNSCAAETIYPICDQCGSKTTKKHYCINCDKLIDGEKCGDHKVASFKKQEIDISRYFRSAMKLAGLLNAPKLIKGIRGSSNKDATPEHLLKMILRAKNNIFVNKEGTTRYDMSEMTITHFKPKEIGTSIEKLKEIGYEKDIYGKELTEINQILELRCQDVILPGIEDGTDEPASKVFFRIALFIDELLVNLYKKEPFYKLKTEYDIVGHLGIALSPHTSAGIVVRIIGFSKTQGFLAHPLLHSIMRRDCLAYETRLPIFDGKKWSFTEIGKVVEKLNPIKKVDLFGTKAVKVKGYKTLGFDSESKCIKEVKIIDFTKHIKSKILKITLEDGRIIRTTKDHKFCVNENGKITKKFAADFKISDEVLISPNIGLTEKNIQSLNLFDIFKGRSDVMVKGISNQIQKIVEQLGSRSRTRQLLHVNKSLLDNSLLRDSFSLDFVERISQFYKLDLSKAKLFAKWDNVLIEPIINLDKNLLWLIGLYIAEGFSRKKIIGKGYYQVDFAASEKEIRGKIVNICFRYFGLKPSYINKERVTFSSRLLYELFMNHLQCGSNAQEKRVPSLIFTLPKDKLGYFLTGYFDGDGSVSLTDARVTCDSISDELIFGLELCLAQFGIYTRRYYYKKEPGPKVREFYIKKQRKIPKFGITKLIFTSTYVTTFFREIGFGLKRKQKILEEVVKKTRPYGMKIKHNDMYVYPKIISIEEDGEEETYCLNVEGHKIIPNNIMTYQCDGDEAGVMLLMDALLNFSRQFLPNRRGVTQDAPLVLTSNLIPSEVDDMVFDMDVAWDYPLEFYEAAEQFKKPYEVKIERYGDNLNKPKQYEGLGFTHHTTDINEGVRVSAYKTIPSMGEKVAKQMALAEKIRAVDESDVARLLIERHFLRDIKGCLRKYSQQQLRCVNCNEILRRVPLAGKCPKCGGKIIFTIPEGSVVKYLDYSLQLAKNYKLSPYLNQTLAILKDRIDSVFGVDPEKQVCLGNWCQKQA